MSQKIAVDVAIFGGGVAGLWALNRLRATGYQAILFETNSLGGGQTIKSQGIIHGGIKYALTGALTGASQAIASMPQRWRNCFEGKGELDLRRVKILSHNQLLWSTGSLASDITGFFASKALKSRVQKIKKDTYPKLLQHPQFKGNVYRLEELVLDNHSLIEALAAPYQDFIFKVNSKDIRFYFETEQAGRIAGLSIEHPNGELRVMAQRYVLTAGEGNQAMMQHLKKAPAQQCRPLQMVVVKLGQAYPFFAHCLDSGMNPRVTITSHQSQDGKFVWYIGGQLAEDGVTRSPAEQIAVAKKELNTLFPWLDLSLAEWRSFYVNRAEAKQPDGKRPDFPCLQSHANFMVGWPTKLALSPLLVDSILTTLEDHNIHPETSSLDLSSFDSLEKPTIAKPVWDEIFESKFEVV